MSRSCAADDARAALLAAQRRSNRQTENDWQRFAGHRERVTALVLEAAGPRLAVLGAGNCNDLDLVPLAARFGEIHLVDLDAEALQRARDRQPPGVARALALHAPLDLSGGALARIAAFRHKRATSAQLDALVDADVDGVLAAFPQRFDTVLSPCVLTQLVQSCHAGLGERHPDVADVAFAVALAHLRTLARLTAPSGTAILVTDTISSRSYPLDDLWGTRKPIDLLHELDAAYNAFSCTAASFVRRILSDDEVIAPLLARPRLVEPWLWHLGPEMTLLVYGFVCRARPAG